MTDKAFPIIELAEWQSCERTDVKLADEDRVLAKGLSAKGMGRVTIDELRHGIRVTAHSWVGVLRFSNFEVRIVPKLAGDNLGLVEMIDFASGLDALRRCPMVRQLANDGSHLLDLIAMLFAEECERVIRAGLLSDYVDEEDELPIVRGRILADRQVLQRFGRVDRVVCRFDEHKQDVPENQLLAFTLDLCARRSTNSTVRRKTRQLGHVIAGVCDSTNLDLRTASYEIVYDRLNEHYRAAHELAWLLLDALGISDLFATGSTRVFSFLLDMNRLFEAFVREVLKRLVTATGCNVLYQKSDRSIIVHAGTNRPYARVIPDFRIRETASSGRKLVLDAKYKLYDTVRVSTSDIYQAFLYAYAFNSDRDAPTAGLIYPSTDPSGGYHELCVRSAGQLANAKVCLVGLPIPAVLDEMKKNVLGPATESLRKLTSSMLTALPASGSGQFTGNSATVP